MRRRRRLRLPIAAATFLSLATAACSIVSDWQPLAPFDADAATPACGAALCLPCVAHDVACDGPQVYECASDRARWVAVGPACATGTTCDPRDGGRCDPCSPAGFFCVGAALRQCASDGRSSSEIDRCESAALCAAGGSSGCAKPACRLGERRCDPHRARVQRCSEGQDGWLDEAPCAPPTTCGGGGVDGECGGCDGAMVGPPMVPVDGRCVDATPVTQAQYQAFRGAVGGDTSGQRPGCAWNLTYQIDNETCGAADSTPPFDPEVTPDLPVVCVDWCDAAAYCAWTGKQLCGARDGTALAISVGDLATPSSSAWLFACTQGGKTAFPYGASHTGACGSPDDALRPVATLPYCHGESGAFSRLHDMNGPLREWEDACAVDGAGDPSTICRLEGGDACNVPFAGARRAGIDHRRGFRCCAP